MILTHTGVEKCTQCPRRCSVNRDNSLGYCSARSLPNVARASLHMWEEPCISGTNGSGTVFFCGCNLNCIFCQNHEINHSLRGEAYDAKRLSDLMRTLMHAGAHNINLVTPAPHIKIIKEAIINARQNGLSIPVVYNSNGYETVSQLKELDGLIDIYLPDMKYIHNDLALKYSGASDYFEYASDALREMYRQVGNIVTDDKGIATRGMLIRHLVLPGSIDETRGVLDFIMDTFGAETTVSLMCQYYPCHKATQPPLSRRLTKREYERAVEYCLDLGFVNAYIQELDSANSAYIPTFDGKLHINCE